MGEIDELQFELFTGFSRYHVKAKSSKETLKCGKCHHHAHNQCGKAGNEPGLEIVGEHGNEQCLSYQ